jgi:predicted RNA-binding Zn-ribbon protein involved in translation (DUF1610 family)
VVLILEIIGIILSLVVVAVLFYCLYRIYKLKRGELTKISLAGVLFIVLLVPSGILIGVFFFEPIAGIFIWIGIGFGAVLLICSFSSMDGGGKYCSACRKAVPSSSRAGMHCPHCGAYWSREEMIRQY